MSLNIFDDFNLKPSTLLKLSIMCVIIPSPLVGYMLYKKITKKDKK